MNAFLISSETVINLWTIQYPKYIKVLNMPQNDISEQSLLTWLVFNLQLLYTTLLKTAKVITPNCKKIVKQISHIIVNYLSLLSTLDKISEKLIAIYIANQYTFLNENIIQLPITVWFLPILPRFPKPAAGKTLKLKLKTHFLTA